MALKDKDEIKELFQKELGNYQVKVDPSLWNGIQAGLGSTVASTGIGSSLGLAGKIIIGASVAAAITVGTILIVNSNKSPEENTITKQNTTEIVVNNSNETVKDQQENIEKTPATVINEENDVAIEASNSDQQEKINVSTAEETNKYINDLKNSNVSSKEGIKTKNNSEQTIVYKEKQEVSPKVELNNDLENQKENNTIDLSKVNIKITQQKNQYVNFSAMEVPSDAQIVWNFGDGNFDRSINPVHFYAEAGTYDVVLTVQSGTQEINKNIQINIQMKGEIGDLPNIFTPNGDGRNDEFFVECKHLRSFQLTVMDYNQKVVFSTNDVNFRWNGLDKNGVPVTEGNYVYIIVAEDEAGNIINKYQRLNIKR